MAYWLNVKIIFNTSVHQAGLWWLNTSSVPYFLFKWARWITEQDKCVFVKPPINQHWGLSTQSSTRNRCTAGSRQTPWHHNYIADQLICFSGQLSKPSHGVKVNNWGFWPSDKNTLQTSNRPQPERPQTWKSPIRVEYNTSTAHT